MSANVDNAMNILLLVHGTYTRATGFRLNWIVSDPDSDSETTGNPALALNSIQDVIIPHGPLTTDQDVIYFTHASRSGIALIKTRASPLDDVHTESLAIICPTSTSLCQAQTWHYISDLKAILETSTDLETRRQTAKLWYSTNVAKRGRSVRILDLKTVTWEEQLADSVYHPLHHLPFFLRIFGPSFVTMYKYVLARMRVIVYVPHIPSQEESHQSNNGISTTVKLDRPVDPDSASTPIIADTSPLLHRPCELASSLTHILSALCGGKDRPCALGFLGSNTSTSTLLSQRSTDSESGWIACTSDKHFLLSKTQSLDLIVDLSPVFNSPSLSEKENTTTISSVPDGIIRSPLLLLPSPSSTGSTAATDACLQLRPTRFTLLDIQLWSDIQGVMKRIERAKQRALRLEEQGRQGMNGHKTRVNDHRQGRSSISDGEDWDDGDFAVPGGWSLPNTNGSVSPTKDTTLEDRAQTGSSSSPPVTLQTEIIDNRLQQPQLPQKSTYTLDLITAFHRHVVSLSKSYATMATIKGSNFSASLPAHPARLCLPPVEFDDLEKAFLEGGRRQRRSSSLNGLSMITEQMTESTLSSINGTSTTVSTSSSPTVVLDKRASIQSERRSTTPTRSSSFTPSSTQAATFSHPASNPRSLSHSPPPNRTSPTAYTSPQSPPKAQPQSRSSSQDSARTALADTQLHHHRPSTPSRITPKSFSEMHVTLGSPTSSGPYSPPPYPYAFPSSFPRRPDTVTSMSSIPTSQFVTPDHSPVLTARNSPVEGASLEGTPTVSRNTKMGHNDDVEPLDMPEPVSTQLSASRQADQTPEPRLRVESKNGTDPDKGEAENGKTVTLNEGETIADDDGGSQSRNSVSFPSATAAPAPASSSTPPVDPNPSSQKKPKRSFWRRRTLSDDVLLNPPPSKSKSKSKSKTPSPSLSLSTLGRTTPISGRESPFTTSKKPNPDTSLPPAEGGGNGVSGILPTESQLLEVEAELREQEARMLAPSPTPPALVSSDMGPRKLKGRSVPADVFLGEKEREELAAMDDEPPAVAGGVDETISPGVEEEKVVGSKVNNNNDGDDDEDEAKKLVLTPVEVLWEKKRAESASPPQDTSDAGGGSARPSGAASPAARSVSPNSSTAAVESALGTAQPLVLSHLFSPQPLPPGAAAPSPNVGPVITSIIDVLRGAIALHGNDASTPTPTTNGNGHVPMDDDTEEPLAPPPPLPAFSSSPARTPTPQSGRNTPRGLPKIDEEEEEERSVSESIEEANDAAATGATTIGGRASHESHHTKHRSPLLQGGHATDSGDADAEGADGDGESGSMTSSVTAAGSVPPGLVPSGFGGLGIAAGGSGGHALTSSPSSPIASLSPGFVSTTATAASASTPSLLLLPSRPSASSPSPSNGLSVPSSPSPSFNNNNMSGAVSPPSPNPKSSSSGNNTPTTTSSPLKKSKSLSKKSAASSSTKGHAVSSSVSVPGGSAPSTSSLISSLTKSLSLSIRPRRLSLLASSSSSSSNSNGGKKLDALVSAKRGKSVSANANANGGSVAEKSGGSPVKRGDMRSRSAPNTLSSTIASSSSTTPTSAPPSNSTSTSTSPTSPDSDPNMSNISNGDNNSGSGGWIKRPRIRSRPIHPSGSNHHHEPIFNMVTLMSADEARSLGIEEWNGRNSGVGTLDLAKEMRRAQEESAAWKKISGGGNTDVGNTNMGAGAGGGASPSSSPSSSSVSPVPRPASSLSSSSRFAPPPKKGILRSRRASLTAFPPAPTTATTTATEPTEQVMTAATPPDLKPTPKSKFTPTLKQKSIFIESSSEMSTISKSIKSKAPTPTTTPKSSLEQKKDTSPPPPVPPLPESSSVSQSSPTQQRSTTPDSTRRKLRKRRKSLMEPLEGAATATTAAVVVASLM